MVTLEAVEEGNCTFDYWEPYSEEIGYPDTRIQITMDDNHTAICYSHVPTTYTLTIYSMFSCNDGECYGGCCPIQVTWVGGNETVPARGNETFEIPQGTTVTIDPLADADTCYFYYWVIDSQAYYDDPNDWTGLPREIDMYDNHIVEVYSGEGI